MNLPMSVRVRYAPSPTGSPHVGNIRTALYNHLFAKKHGGVNILRIEDTDRTRYVEGCEEDIIESLRYVGVEWQEGLDVGGSHGPYRQSERKESGIYQEVIDRLLAEGIGYWAFDTPEELNEMREFQQINKKPTGYFGGMWRDASESQVVAAKADGKPGVIRLRIPRDKTIVVQDVIRGRLEFDSNTVDDPVLIKADGMPTYHFAAMVDDHFMEITHVFRGEEWISSAPKHVVLIESLGWSVPELVHLPVIKGKDGSKLSKRHGDTACLDFRRAGYLGDALANFIALIGWAPGGDREIMSMEEMCDAFDLKGIQPSSGIFDIDKLNWMTGTRIRAISVPELFDRAVDYASSQESKDYWAKKAAEDESAKQTIEDLDRFATAAANDPDYVRQAVELEQERVGSLADFGSACAFFLMDEPPVDQKAVDKWKGQAHIKPMLEHFIAEVDKADSVTVESCEAMIRDYAASAGIEKLGPIVHPVRIALTGKSVGPGLWQLMAVLGKERLLARFRRNLGLFD